MKIYINILGKEIPSYGFMIVLGVIFANIIAYFRCKKEGLDIDKVMLFEAYGLTGAFIGAKLLYIIVSFKLINWSEIKSFSDMNTLMNSGFVFYGGLIGGIIAIALASFFEKTDIREYLKKLIFLIPFAHAFGRIGCFMAGCCYGRPYDGRFAVVFPETSVAPSGVMLFPVQIVESICLFVISAVLALISRKHSKYIIELYFIMYAILRFIMEFFRYDSYRGAFLNISTSQWISIFVMLISIVIIIKNRD